MVCGNCGLDGHNNRNLNCPSKLVRKNLTGMAKFTQTQFYYIISLRYITTLYPAKVCLSLGQVVWDANNRHISGLTELFINKDVCTFKYMFSNLNIRIDNTSHANFLLLDIRNRTMIRYEPHGSSSRNDLLDNVLYNFCVYNQYLYVPPVIYCPNFGIQTMSQENIGLCQTSVLYALLSMLNPNKYDYSKATSSKINARKSLGNLMITLLTHIYTILPNNFKSLFLNYDNLSESDKNNVNRYLFKEISPYIGTI